MNAHPATLAKLTRPHLTGILSRERLFDYLDQGREKSVIWVSGPPGTGKTTLVADYLDTWAPECIWYQADEGDADVAPLDGRVTRLEGDEQRHEDDVAGDLADRRAGGQGLGAIEEGGQAPPLRVGAAGEHARRNRVLQRRAHGRVLYGLGERQ